MAKVHNLKLRSYKNFSTGFSKKGYELLWKYFDDTNDTLNKLKFVEDDSANESDVFTRNESETPRNWKEEEKEPETMKQACQNGNFSRVKYLVESGLEDVNKSDEQNVYPLHWAAINNRLQVAKYLLEKGANVDSIGGELETTPLNWAVSAGHVEIVKLLIESGANKLSFNNEGYASIHIAAINGHYNVAAYLLANGVNVSFYII